MANVNSKDNNKAIMQIQLDQNDAESTSQELKEYASLLSGALGYDVVEIIEEMTKDDTRHMIHVFQKYFGDYIEILDIDQVVTGNSAGKT